MTHAHSQPVYIVAVSGGIDSVVLLDMIVNHRLPGNYNHDAQIVVAHVNHGIRQNSERDQQFVKELAERHGLSFETVSLALGPDCSEEKARDARYGFIDSIAKKYHTNYIFLAHHFDDSIETTVMNLMRGTGRRGVGSLKSREGRLRPLLTLTKSDIEEYAREHQLAWVYDETNDSLDYTRNYVRNKLLTNAPIGWKDEFANHLQKITLVNTKLDQEIANLLQYKLRSKAVISRSLLLGLDHSLSCEIMVAMLRKIGVVNVDKELVEKLVLALKVSRPGLRYDVDARIYALVTKRSLRFVNRETNKTLSV